MKKPPETPKVVPPASNFPLTIEQEFHAYKKRVTQNPNTLDFYLPLPTPAAPDRIIQYHFSGKETFGAVFDVHHRFRSYIPNVSLN
jgi:hypothetical protein